MPDIEVPAELLLAHERERNTYRVALERIAGCDSAEGIRMIEYAETALTDYPKEAHVEDPSR